MESKLVAKSRSELHQQKDDGLIFLNSLARLTKRANDWPYYNISTHLERERVIAELVATITDFALPFFARFNTPEEYAREVAKTGFLPHRKGIDTEYSKARREDFVRCYCRSGDQ